MALYEPTSRGARLAVCSRLACQHGLRPGMSRSEAEVLAGNGEVTLLPADFQADRSKLTELALLCHARFSPTTAVEEAERPECLFLDIQGCAHLFRGEHGMAQEVRRFIRTQGWRARCALADTPGAAWALAHFDSGSVVIVAAGRTVDALKPLPLAALRLPGKALLTLAELGIQRIEQLLAWPRAELASRFGPIVPQRLRQALGLEPELLTLVKISEPIVARWESEDPISDPAVVEQLCDQLLGTILETCLARGVALLRCECRLSASARSESYTVELVHPSDDQRHILSLLELQWKRRPFPEVIQGIVMEAAQTGHRRRPSGLLFDSSTVDDQQAASRLVERLSSRLGAACVVRASLHPDSQPEVAFTRHPCLEGIAKGAPARGKETVLQPMVSLPWDRPLTLRPPRSIKVWSVVPHGPPLRIQWRRQLRMVMRWWAPERIETGWWRGRQSRRVYYRVELETGEWLWLFRSDDRWHLHGLFD